MSAQDWGGEPSVGSYIGKFGENPRVTEGLVSRVPSAVSMIKHMKMTFQRAHVNSICKERGAMLETTGLRLLLRSAYVNWQLYKRTKPSILTNTDLKYAKNFLRINKTYSWPKNVCMLVRAQVTRGSRLIFHNCESLYNKPCNWIAYK